MSKKAKIFIGTSGYNYRHWSDGVFYPEGLPQSRWLEHYTEFFNTVELNVTFYRLPQESAFKGWHKRTPKNFAFTIKGSRFITHIKRLKDCKEPLELLYTRVRHLKEKFSSLLWQLPPKFKVDEERLSGFVKLLKIFKARHVFEFRDKSWFQEKTYDILRKHNVSLCFADWPITDMKVEPTADFVYIRRHGAGQIVYGGCYSDKLLKRDTKEIKEWLKEGKDVYVYFNNDAHGYAVKNALTLKKSIVHSL